MARESSSKIARARDGIGRAPSICWSTATQVLGGQDVAQERWEECADGRVREALDIRDGQRADGSTQSEPAEWTNYTTQNLHSTTSGDNVRGTVGPGRVSLRRPPPAKAVEPSDANSASFCRVCSKGSVDATARRHRPRPPPPRSYPRGRATSGTGNRSLCVCDSRARRSALSLWVFKHANTPYTWCIVCTLVFARVSLSLSPAGGDSAGYTGRQQAIDTLSNYYGARASCFLEMVLCLSITRF